VSTKTADEILGTLAACSAAAIAALRHLGVEVVTLTGGNATIVAATARATGVRRVVAEVLPEHKASEIHRLQAEGRKVGMIGNGINDAPALAAPDVGPAIGTGTAAGRSGGRRRAAGARRGRTR
jgi:P-type Cu+ transporter